VRALGRDTFCHLDEKGGILSEDDFGGLRQRAIFPATEGTRIDGSGIAEGSPRWFVSERNAGVSAWSELVGLGTGELARPVIKRYNLADRFPNMSQLRLMMALTALCSRTWYPNSLCGVRLCVGFGGWRQTDDLVILVKVSWIQE
jgi:hypothetical protein